ncbi:nonsense-mediated mRNA decay 2 protein [Aspergillus saccharolyticus JOP 1030-1]|uniref:Nonsense-mediated mRNA decay 2 protein n=1 Tax=Aspergillus saccharolyticus JOP 1030-1 TaxID=1450539 RepID=A0A318ZQ91_9EURO|nr:nonsense-mediated mRNA decay 2 protein [Aspergillus saccharolyticus JOP 1030-1]PYH48795.1 nonsense-mediated mRNA decay 2 protein [Aspergillus saccharolyticus JOP 1030-1]
MSFNESQVNPDVIQLPTDTTTDHPSAIASSSSAGADIGAAPVGPSTSQKPWKPPVVRQQSWSNEDQKHELQNRLLGLEDEEGQRPGFSEAPAGLKSIPPTVTCGLRISGQAMDRHRKRELRTLNEKAWAGETDIFPVSKSLDSALKKNTAFIKRLRTGINASAQQTFLADIRTLSLHKYLSEIISACYEGLCKLKSPGEIATGVEIASALHQRFGPGEFTRQIGWLLGRGLSTPDKGQLKALSQEVREREEKERLSRHRVLLRVVTELWLVGVLRTLDDIDRPEDLGAAATKGKDGGVVGKTTDGPVKSSKAPPSAARDGGEKESEPFPLEVLKDLLGHDRDHLNLPLAVLFVKSFSWDVLGTKLVEEGRKTVEADGATTTTTTTTTNGASGDGPNGAGAEGETEENEPPLISEKLQLRFRHILNRYLEDVKAHVVRDQRALAAQSRRNAEAYVKSGEIFEDRQANFEKQTKSLEKLVANTQVLCEALGAEMPALAEKETSDAASAGGIGLVKTTEYLRGQGEGAGIWEDEEERRFYENLVDLKGKVPAVLLEDAKKKKPESDEAAKKKADGEDSGAEKTESSAQPQASEEKGADADDQSTAIASRTVGAQVDALLAKLPDLQTKDHVDQMALDFCFLNSKASRNRLIKAVSDVPKGRLDLLPLYARLVATLGQYMPDIPQGLTTYLDEEFRSLQRRKSKEFLGQVRMSNVRYLAELTKFGVVPEHIIFHCFKVSLDDFSRMNIEIIGNLLENCGRYLLRNPETAPRMASFLETLGRKKTVQHLGQQERMVIENAVYYVDPPPRPAIQQKERTPMEIYIRRLVYMDMHKRNYTKILKSLRKLHWEEGEVVGILEKVFSKPVKLKYGNIHLLAILVSALYRYHQEFVIGIVDNVLEHITLGLELNDFKFNQKRVAEVKYLGELYNYKMIDSPVIFDTLYRIVTFGHEGGTPMAGRINQLDQPDDFFRIRLVCTLLDTCGHCFDRGSAKKKLDFFLSFFQYYIYTKDPLPMDIEFLVQDTYSMTRPQWKLAADLTEATQLFGEAVAQNYKMQDAERPAEPEDEDAESSSSDDDLEEDAIPEAEDDQESSDEAEASGPNAENTGDSESEDEQIFVTRQEEERDPEAEADFDREFEKMMAESMESRKFERKGVFDIPLPMKRSGREAVAAEPVAEPPKPTTNTMAFSLMTKKGNKQQTRTIDLPSDSSFAVAMRSQQQADREEQQRIKNLVLNYEMTNEVDADAEAAEKRSPHRDTRLDKSASNRMAFRSRKLQLSDVNW